MPRIAGILVLLVLASTADAAPCDDQCPLKLSDRLVRSTVEVLASDRLAGRDNDTPASDKAQEILIRRLRRAGHGLNPAGLHSEAFKQHFTINGQTGTNLLAVVRGSELPDEYVVVGAHYDHLDTRSNAAGACRSGGTPGGEVCNGATDNATGTALVVAIGRALKKHPPRRSVVLALWDSEEDGLLGSLYYVNNPLVPLAQTVAYVNFDIQGSDLLPSLSTTSFAVGPETGTGLTELALAAIQGEAFGTLPISYIFGQLRSDYANFVDGSVPTVFFSDSTNGCYHTINDDVDVVDWTKLGKQARIGLRVTKLLADTDTPPTFVAPNPSLAEYRDAVTLAQVFEAGSWIRRCSLPQISRSCSTRAMRSHRSPRTDRTSSTTATWASTERRAPGHRRDPADRLPQTLTLSAPAARRSSRAPRRASVGCGRSSRPTPTGRCRRRRSGSMPRARCRRRRALPCGGARKRRSGACRDRRRSETRSLRHARARPLASTGSTTTPATVVPRFRNSSILSCRPCSSETQKGHQWPR
jgi:hypothetical protein